MPRVSAIQGDSSKHWTRRAFGIMLEGAARWSDQHLPSMDRIRFEVVPSSAEIDPPPAVVEIFVNGRRLAELVREHELPFAAREGHPELAGSYDGLPAADVLPPSRHFLGNDAGFHGGVGDRVMLLGCACGEPSCWPLLARIRVDGGRVTWSEFTQPLRPAEQPHGWRYGGFGPFVFDRAQHDAEIRRFLQTFDVVRAGLPSTAAFRVVARSDGGRRRAWWPFRSRPPR